MPQVKNASRRLILLKVSPWSERAKWALDHHGLSYQTIEHAPFLGERRLRRLVGESKERATVPVLIDEKEVISDSWEIALYADREGQSTRLIPDAHEEEIRSYNDLADRTMAAGRALIVASMLASPEAVDESLPPGVPKFVRPLLRPIGRFASEWFARKYELRLEDTAKHRETLRATLETLRAALKKSSPYLLGAFSYADIIMATTLQGILPVADRYIRLGPATRKVWTQPELAREYAELIEWRDRLYDQHRKGPSGKSPESR